MAAVVSKSPWKKGQYVLIRAASAGVFVGLFESRDGDRVILTDARRIWYWAGAASISQLAQSGTSRPNDCKFPAAVDRIEVLGVIEILATTAAARKSIEGVRPWAM